MPNLFYCRCGQPHAHAVEAKTWRLNRIAKRRQRRHSRFGWGGPVDISARNSANLAIIHRPRKNGLNERNQYA
jgi:hypothetical protein